MRFLLLLMLVPATGLAETTFITIPGEGWSFRVNAPPFTRVESRSADRRFRFTASSVETGVTPSVHVEIEGGANNK